eukprot:jgi/Mesen1/2387/ME000157S01526
MKSTEHLPERYDVVIVGAGLAGLQAAQSLRREAPTLRIIVVEASSRIGGRIKSVSGMAPWPVELGAEFLHGRDHSSAKRLADAMGCAQRELPYHILSPSRFAPASPPLFCFASPDRYYLGASRRLLTSDEAEQDADLAALHALFADLGDVEAPARDLPVSEYLRLKGATPSQLAFAESIYANDFGCSLSKLGARECVAEARAWIYGDSYFILDRPLSAMAHWLARGLEVRIDWPVEEICLGRQKGVRVSGPGGACLEAERVVITVPAAILKERAIKFVPALPDAKLAAIDAIGIALLPSSSAVPWPGGGAAPSRIQLPRVELVLSECVVLAFSHCFWPEGLFDIVFAGCFLPEIWMTEYPPSEVESSPPPPCLRSQGQNTWRHGNSGRPSYQQHLGSSEEGRPLHVSARPRTEHVSCRSDPGAASRAAAASEGPAGCARQAGSGWAVAPHDQKKEGCARVGIIPVHNLQYGELGSGEAGAGVLRRSSNAGKGVDASGAGACCCCRPDSDGGGGRGCGGAEGSCSRDACAGDSTAGSGGREGSLGQFVAVGFVAGDAADAISRMPPEEVVGRALAQLDEVFRARTTDGDDAGAPPVSPLRLAASREGPGNRRTNGTLPRHAACCCCSCPGPCSSGASSPFLTSTCQSSFSRPCTPSSCPSASSLARSSSSSSSSCAMYVYPKDDPFNFVNEHEAPASSAFAGACIADWSKEPFTRGAYTHPTVGADGARDALGSPVAGRLFFAGEATHPGVNPCMQAALDTGVRAAFQVMAASRSSKL